MSARSLNKVMLIGNLTRDPEMRYTPQGTAVVTFGLATNRSWTANDGGDRQEETEYHRIVAWSKLAEICSQLLYKGRKVYVEGRLQTRKWTGQDGYERETTEVVIDSMIALGAPKGQSAQGYSDDYATDDGAYGSSSQQTNVATSQANDTNDNSVTDDTVDEIEPDKDVDKKKLATKKVKEEEDALDADDIPF